jgi:hypothetical protein
MASWSSPLVFHSCCRFSGSLLLINISVSSSLLVLMFSDFARRCSVLAFLCVASSSAAPCKAVRGSSFHCLHCSAAQCLVKSLIRPGHSTLVELVFEEGFVCEYDTADKCSCICDAKIEMLTFAGALPRAYSVTCLSSPNPLLKLSRPNLSACLQRHTV